MDQNFQTSFIPKKPIVEERVASVQSFGFLFIISIFILIIVLLGTGGLYFYKTIVTKSIGDKTSQLQLAQNGFEPSKLSELQLLDKRLNAAKEILSNHVTVIPVFTELENITMHTVRYTKFSYNLAADGSGAVDVKMSGVAAGYRALALQSDLFGQDKNFINPIFSNFTLDDSGNVLFDLDFSVKSSFVNYEQTIKAQS